MRLIPILAILLLGASPTRISVRQLLTSTPTTATVRLYGSQDGNTFIPVTLGAGLTQTLAGGVLTISAAGSGAAVAPVLGTVLKFDSEASAGFYATVPDGNWQVVIYRNGLRQTATLDYDLILTGVNLYITPKLIDGASWPAGDLVTVDLFAK